MPSTPANDAPVSVRKQALAFAQAHLHQMVGELRHWRRTGLLPAGSLMTELGGILEPECVSGDSMQQAEHIVTSLALDSVADNDCFDDLKRRLDWAAQALRDTAGRGRTQLGEGHPEVLQVLGTVRACLEVLANNGHTATAPEAQSRSVNLRLPVTPGQAADLTMQLAEAYAEGRLPLPTGLTLGIVGTASSAARSDDHQCEPAGASAGTTGTVEASDAPPATATRRLNGGNVFKVSDRDLDRLLNFTADILGVHGQPNMDEGLAWMDALETLEARLQPPPTIAPDRLGVLTRVAFEATIANEYLSLHRHWYRKGVRAGYSVLHEIVTAGAGAGGNPNHKE